VRTSRSGSGLYGHRRWTPATGTRAGALTLSFGPPRRRLAPGTRRTTQARRGIAISTVGVDAMRSPTEFMIDRLESNVTTDERDQRYDRKSASCSYMKHRMSTQ
jgi:hypothetical protein